MAKRQAIRSVSEEFRAAELGDERLRRRLMTIAERVSAAPDASFPQASGSDGELEGVYRFFGNGKVSAEAILEPHIRETVRRAKQAQGALVIHDTTSFVFGGTTPREGLGWIHKQGASQGFFGHFALAVTANDERRPLGIVGMSSVVRTGTPLGREVSGRARTLRSDKESDRWTLLAAAVHQDLPDAVHVMDREADAFQIFEELSWLEASFVIRAREGDNRIILVDDERIPLSELRQQQPVRLKRTVRLSRRQPSPTSRMSGIHPPRAERTATLEVRSKTICLPRPSNQSRFAEPRTLQFNAVWVTEKGQPRGEEPVSWLLITNLSIASKDDLAAVVDAYRARWIIEEFFKALKTGCAFEKRQLESFHALMNALAVFSVIAWRLLLLRAVARQAPHTPASAALTGRQLRMLTQLSQVDDARVRRVRLPDRPTTHDALMAVAGLGGHLKNNGLPGWQVLGRGFEAMLLLELGWRARETCDR